LLGWQEAAARGDRLTFSPLVNTNRNGGFLQIMQQEFKHAIGVVIVQGNAKQKLWRLHYDRETADKAAHASWVLRTPQ
jgi:hypothetical protein